MSAKHQQPISAGGGGKCPRCKGTRTVKSPSGKPVPCFDCRGTGTTTSRGGYHTK